LSSVSAASCGSLWLMAEETRVKVNISSGNLSSFY
jgi:hypothetical protein